VLQGGAGRPADAVADSRRSRRDPCPQAWESDEYKASHEAPVESPQLCVTGPSY